MAKIITNTLNLIQVEIVVEAHEDMPIEWAVQNALTRCISEKQNIRLKQGRYEVLIDYNSIIKQYVQQLHDSVI